MSKVPSKCPPVDVAFVHVAVLDPSPWGTVYGLPYDMPDGRRVWMCRGRYNRVRFYTAEGEQVGPEQLNVAPAVAFALSRGWRQAKHG